MVFPHVEFILVHGTARVVSLSAPRVLAFPEPGWLEYVLALKFKMASAMLDILADILDFNVGSIRDIPLIDLDEARLGSLAENTRELIGLSPH